MPTNLRFQFSLFPGKLDHSMYSLRLYPPGGFPLPMSQGHSFLLMPTYSVVPSITATNIPSVVTWPKETTQGAIEMD